MDFTAKSLALLLDAEGLGCCTISVMSSFCGSSNID